MDKKNIDFAETLVEGAYRGLLGREPDPVGRKAWIDWLWKNGLNLDKFFELFSHNKEFERRFISMAIKNGTAPLFNECSQYGEISLLVAHIVDSACRNKIVIDVGARGIERSNSYDLMKHLKWRGVLIEAHPELCINLREQFKDLASTVVHSAVSDFEGTADLHLGVNLDISSLNSDATASWGGFNWESLSSCSTATEYFKITRNTIRF